MARILVSALICARACALAFALAYAVLFCLNASAAELPTHLRDTGLYEPNSLTVRAENLPFTPQYPLWSDGADKHRWIYLPPGTQIDASDVDAWVFPVGTKLWKEFRHGKAIETRYMERTADGSWQFTSYIWNEAGTDAVLAPAQGVAHLGVANLAGGTYAIPAQDDCRACHEGSTTPVLGFSALQLSPDRDPVAVHVEPLRSNDVSLNTLVALGLVRNVSSRLIENAPHIDGRSPVERAALGYLHGNCGHCHNAAGSLASLDLVLSQSAINRNPASALQQHLINVASAFRPQGRLLKRVSPGEPLASVIALRMSTRNLLEQMPPLGTRVVDQDGVALITRWITELSSRLPAQ